MNEGYQREVRFAVSMVGGTSLAIHMHGAAQELQKLARCEGVYQQLSQWTGSKPVIDILSGTSAGGINGILLATALTNNSDITEAQSVFESMADIDRLVYPLSSKPESVLRGEAVIHKSLEEVFERLVTGGAGQDDIDLYVTGTYLQGFPQTYFDSVGGRIYTKEHLGVFHFMRRPGEKGRNDFSHSKALALAGRTTSSLPAIFEASRVERKYLPQEQPPVLPFPEGIEQIWMGDGGYLDVRPLDLVVDAIVRKPVKGLKVERKVILVEPAPDPFEPMKPDKLGPNPVTHLLDYSKISSSQSLHKLLREVDRHNQDVDKIQSALNTARATFKRGGSKKTDYQIDLYVDTCVEELVQNVEELWATRLGIRASRLVGGQKPIESHEELRRRATYLKRCLELLRRHVLDGSAQALRSELQERDFLPNVLFAAQQLRSPEAPPSSGDHDILALERKILRVINEAYLAFEATGRECRESFQQLYHLYDQAGKLKANLAQAYTDALPPLDQEDRLLEQLQGAQANELLRQTEVMTRDLEGVIGELSAAFKEEKNGESIFCRGHSAKVIKDYFCWLEVHLFPLEYAASFSHAQRLDVVMLDPHERLGLCQEDPDKKVAGDELFKFGGFLRHSWRLNDILWGRLDASAKLIKVLMDPGHAMERYRGDEEALLNDVLGYLKGGSNERFSAPFQSLKAEEFKGCLEDNAIWRELCHQIALRYHYEVVNDSLPRLMASDLVETARWQSESQARDLLVAAGLLKDQPRYQGKGAAAWLPAVEEQLQDLLSKKSVEELGRIHKKLGLGGQTLAVIPPAVNFHRFALVGLAAVRAVRFRAEENSVQKKVSGLLAGLERFLALLVLFASTLVENRAMRAAAHAVFLTSIVLLGALSLLNLIPFAGFLVALALTAVYWYWQNLPPPAFLALCFFLGLGHAAWKCLNFSWPIHDLDPLKACFPAGTLLTVGLLLYALSKDGKPAEPCKKWPRYFFWPLLALMLFCAAQSARKAPVLNQQTSRSAGVSEKAFPPGGWPGGGIVCYEFIADSTRAQELFKAWGVEGVERARKSLEWDSGFAVSYLLFGLFGGLWLYRRRGWQVMNYYGGCAMLAGGLDLAENYILYDGLQNPEANFKLAAFLAGLKFALIWPFLLTGFLVFSEMMSPRFQEKKEQVQSNQA